jgi:hypothetical protein
MRALLLLHVAVIASASPVLAGELALKRVMLSSAGVGYFEYEAQVDGPAALGLDVKLDQVDDVLKSLVVFDGVGGVGAVELPGRDESHAAFGNVPFGPEGLASPLAFLNSLQGVDVVVQGPRPMQGRILRAESVREPAGAPGQEGPVRTRVTVLTTDGLKQFVLEESDAVQVADPVLRDSIGRAVVAARRQSAQDSRRLTITSRGNGSRTVRASYVTVAPLWKASYRLVLPSPDADPATAKARLQGWATLENVSGSDWSKISLALQYGNPVTFHQAIYRSYFVTRPEVPVEVLGRLLPDVDTRARAVPGSAPVSMPPPPPAPAPVMAPMMRMAAPAPKQEIAMAGAAEPIAVQEGTTETVFTLPDPIDLAAGHSASVPILDVEVPASRVALATPGQQHPLAAIRVANTSPSSLPAGVLTLYDAQGDAPYAGDARLGGLPAGESRLISYAQDLRTSMEWRNEDAVTVASLKASKGVLEVDQRNRRVTHATFTAPPSSPRRMLVEVPKPAGATVAAGFAQPAEETASSWRFVAELKPGETKDLTYAIDQHERRSITLLEDDDAIASVLNLQGASPAARAALEGLSALRARESARSAEKEQFEAQQAAVEKDEERLRANLAALQPGDALRTRLLRQLDADETKHAQLDASIETTNQAVNAAHRALEDAINALRI